MLALKRRNRESVIVQVRDITIRVTLVRGYTGAAKLGFSGPPEARFIREELLTSDETNNLGSP